MRWQRRFQSQKPDWDDRKLFRSLNMANAAAALSSQGDFTPYDSGRAIALWASAFEILAHPGNGQSGHLQVYELLEKATWNLTACREARHPAMAPLASRRPRILACAIYSRIHSARNDYLHGNHISDVQLVVHPSKRFVPKYAPVLFGMALTAFLDLRFKEQKPPPEDQLAYDAYEDRAFAFTTYQRRMESALATIDVTEEQQARRRGLIP
jgi:hypothetical protein